MTDAQQPPKTWEQVLDEMAENNRRITEQVNALEASEISPERLRAHLVTVHMDIATIAAGLKPLLSEPPPLDQESRREFTKIRIAALFEEARELTKAELEFATMGLRSLILVNGGALVGMLTFIGNYDSAPAIAGSLWSAFAWFVGGLMASLAATVFAYISQGFSSQASDAGATKIYFGELRNQQAIEAKQSDIEKQNIKFGRVWSFIAIAAAVLSALLFSVGCFACLSTLQSGFGGGA